MNQLKAASVQFNHKAGDKEENLNRIHHFVKTAKQQNVELILFPEMCITGYWHIRKLAEKEIRQLAETVPSGSSSKFLQALAKEHAMTIGAGLIEQGEDNKL